MPLTGCSPDQTPPPSRRVEKSKQKAAWGWLLCSAAPDAAAAQSSPREGITALGVEEDRDPRE